MKRAMNIQRGLKTGVALMLAAAGLTLFAGTAIAQEAGSVADGAKAYGDVCGTCHNPRSPLERNDRDWVTVMNHMRVRANMTGKQFRDVVAFLQATNQDPASQPVATAVEPGPVAGVQDADAVAEGQRLVGEKACLGCHIIGDAGGNVGPALNGVIGRKGTEYTVRKILDPTFDNSTSMMPGFGLSEEEAGWVAAYLATLD